MELDATKESVEAPRIVYVVNHLKWQWTDEWFAIQDDEPVRAFVSFTEAEKYRQILEAESQAHRQESMREWYTPYTENSIPEPFYEVVAVELFP